MHPLETYTRSAAREDLLGSALFNCYQWAKARVVIKEGDFPGPYSSRFYPWMPEVLNSKASVNWVMKGAQTGLTVGGLVQSFYQLDRGKDILYVMPTGKKAAEISKTRFSKIVKGSPYLANHVRDTEDVKMLRTATLYIGGAKNDVNLKSTPVSVVILDEVDELEERQIYLAFERMSGRLHSLLWGYSTPKFPSLGIHKLYLQGTQEHLFFKCPGCSKRIELLWPDSFHVCGDGISDPDCMRSYLKCSECGVALPHESKSEWLKGCKWYATAADKSEDQRSFYLNQLYSPTVPPGKIAIAYFRGLGDEAAEREFHNSKLGLPYVEPGGRVTDEDIDRCVSGLYDDRKPYRCDDDLPNVGPSESGRLITVGVDQGKQHYWVAVEWFVDMKNEIGDINDRSIGKLLGFGTFEQDDWPWLESVMRKYQALACVIDVNPQPTPARRFARGACCGHVWLCHYVVGRAPREIFITDDDYGAPIVKVDKTGWTGAALGRIMQGRIQFPSDISLEFRRQVKGQVRTYKKGVDGNYQAFFHKVEDDHYGHALTYAEIALRIAGCPTDDVISNIYQG